MRRLRVQGTWVAVAVVALCGVPARSEEGPVLRAAVLPVVAERPAVGVGEPVSLPGQAVPGGRRHVHTALPIPDNTPLAYEQFPRILTPHETGDIRVVAEVVGDVRTVSFRRNVPALPTGYVEETWTRSTTRSVNGRLLSVFDQSYPGAILGDLLVYAHGNDLPQVPLGRVMVPDAADAAGTGSAADSALETVWLRLAPSNLPASTVRVMTPPGAGTPVAQYASHVVNLVIPGFGDERVLDGDDGFAFASAARRFYEYFADAYHTLAFVPRRSPLASSTALNINVKNDIEGIGAAVVDEQATYGSGLLRSVQLYGAGFVGQHETTVHQLAHHWGDATNLAAIAGVDAAGYRPEIHTPLLSGGATLIGSVLDGTREVEGLASSAPGVDAAFQIVDTTAPVTFHPLQLYRMGLLAPSAVPDVSVFVDQGQFGSGTPTAPASGTVVTGDRRTVSINQIMAALGPRDGPVFTEWRQAVVVVSDELVSQTEMDYYNYYARRAAATTGTRSYDGFGSFFEATGNRVTLRTDVDPLDAVTHPKIDEAAPVADAPFGRRDWRGLVFDAPVPSRVAVGATLRLTGSIDPEVLPEGYQFLVLRASRYGDPPSAATTMQTTVSGGRFSVSLRFTAAQAGAYAVDAFVFDATSPAIPTSVVTPLFVD